MAKSSSPTCPSCNNFMGYNKMKCPHCGHVSQVHEPVNHDDFDWIWLSKVKSAAKDRLSTGPWDRVWGGDVVEEDGIKKLIHGMVKTSVTLLGGAPGAGKSTLTSHIIANMPEYKDEQDAPVYVAAEEAVSEIKLRTDRLGFDPFHGKDVRMVPAMNGASVGAVLTRFTPKIIIIDSLQGLVGEDSAAQEEVCKIAKVHAVRLKAPVIIISHVTKDEVLAGKNTLQHTVDVTMVFYPSEELRVLMCLKNRFGPAYKEVGFHMTATGLVYAPSDDDEDLNEEDTEDEEE